MGVFMKKKKVDSTTNSIPNFILCDMGLQSAFAQMCQSFQKSNAFHNPDEQNWVIIDNDTGKIITPQK